MNAALLKSERMDWRTPPEILDLVRQMGPIGLDPATDDDNPTNAKEFYSSFGKSRPWRGHGLVWCNPPYGREIKEWAWKACHEFSRFERANAQALADGFYDDELIMLVPARPDTQWFQEHISWTADAICFWRGRIKFVGAKDSAPFPSALPYWGPRVDRFKEVFGAKGWIVTP